jgi:hypothetical protein
MYFYTKVSGSMGMTLTSRFVCGCLMVGSLALMVGCGGTTSQSGTSSNTAGHGHSHGHDHGHDHATDYPGAVKELEGLSAKILKAFQDGNPAEAHDELHEIGHVLERIPALAAKEEGMSDEAKTQVKQAIESLFDAFSEMDGMLHGGDTVDVDALTERVNRSLADLRSAGR